MIPFAAPITGYIAGAAMLAGLAGGWGASHYLAVVPMQLAASQAVAQAATAAAAAESHNRIVEQETSHALDTLVTSSQSRERAAGADLDRLSQRLRDARAAAAGGQLPAVPGPSGAVGPVAGDGLPSSGQGADGSNRAAPVSAIDQLGAAGSLALDALSAGSACQARLERATAAALACARLTTQ